MVGVAARTPVESAAFAGSHRASLVDGQRATIKFLTVPHLDGGGCAFIGGHFHKAEASGTTGHFVFHDRGGGNFSSLGECLPHAVVGRVERQVADI